MPSVSHIVQSVLSLVLVALVGCGGTKPADKKTTLLVGFSQAGSESSWRVAETGSIKAEAEKRNVTLKFADAQGDQSKQIQALTGFIAQRVDAIILAPIVETGWDQVLAKAKAKKIPVILVDRGVKVKDDALYDTLIASDFILEGKLAAEWLAKATGEKAKIVQLEGTPGAAPAIDRKKGFDDVIAQHPGMTILASQSGDFVETKGKELMESLIKAHSDVTAVYAHNDDMALGAIQAIREAGKTPGKDIIVLSIDGVKRALETVLEGSLNCSVECSPLLGPMAFDAVQKVLAGETLPKRTVVQDRVFDAKALTPEFVAARPY
jgi:ABC-type sugar transport system substrate-binding protein